MSQERRSAVIGLQMPPYGPVMRLPEYLTWQEFCSRTMCPKPYGVFAANSLSSIRTSTQLIMSIGARKSLLELRSHRLPRSRRPDSMQPRPAWADTGAEAFGTMPCRLSVIVTLDTRHPSTAISAPTCQVGWSKVLPSITRLETAWEG